MTRLAFDQLHNLSAVGVVATIVCLVPGYFLCRDILVPQAHIMMEQNMKTLTTAEEDILHAKFLTTHKHTSDYGFLDSHTYRERRVERVQKLFENVSGQINQNLEEGNRVFLIDLEDPDEKIINVTRRLLTEKLSQQGYTIHMNKVKKTIDENNVFQYAIQVE